MDMPNGYHGDWLGEMPPFLFTPPEEAPHLGHSKHLCDMAKRGVDLNAYKELVKNAKFICKKCGRAAAKEENLCEPVPL